MVSGGGGRISEGFFVCVVSPCKMELEKHAHSIMEHVCNTVLGGLILLATDSAKCSQCSFQTTSTTSNIINCNIWDVNIHVHTHIDGLLVFHKTE